MSLSHFQRTAMNFIINPKRYLDEFEITKINSNMLLDFERYNVQDSPSNREVYLIAMRTAIECNCDRNRKGTRRALDAISRELHRLKNLR